MQKKLTLVFTALVLSISAAVAKPPTDGMVLWLRNGASTLKAKDSSREKNNGKAASLVIPNSPSLVSMQSTRQLTLAVWIKPNSVPSEFPDVLCKGLFKTTGTNGGYELGLNAHGDNEVLFYSGEFYADTEGSNGSLINNHLGEWIHLAVVVDAAAQTVQIYVNGVAYSNIFTSGTLSDVNFDVSNDLYIGAADPLSTSNRADFDGDIRQVLIYNRTLSSDEIQSIISSTRPK